MIFRRWFFKKRKKFDPQIPPQGNISIKKPQTSENLHSYSIDTFSSHDQHRIKLTSLSISLTFNQPIQSTPWASSAEILNVLSESKINSLLPFNYLQNPVEIDDLKNNYISLPPFIFRLHFTCEDYIPDEDDSCYGSQGSCVWFFDKSIEWESELKKVIQDHLIWESIAKPLWRN